MYKHVSRTLLSALFACSRPAASASCCRIAGSPCASPPDRFSRRQDGLAGRLLRDGDGNTWVGRGPRPQWLRDALASGRSLGNFAI